MNVLMLARLMQDFAEDVLADIWPLIMQPTELFFTSVELSTSNVMRIPCDQGFFVGNDLVDMISILCVKVKYFIPGIIVVWFV